MNDVLVVSAPAFRGHTPPPGHPEAPERADVFDVVADSWRARGGTVIPAEPASRVLLERVHTPEYLDRLQVTAGSAVMLDPDTFTSPESWSQACLAAGAAVSAVRAVMAGTVPRALVLARPPGHHALADRAMGFCLLNNVAVAAADLLASGLERVAIVDIDVHHGNGTQAIFAAERRVLFVSLHQSPLYPGTGAAEDVDDGMTVNVPLPRWCTEAEYLQAFDRVVEPIVSLFAPQCVLVSAGFDAHEHDPLAAMRLTAGAFHALGVRLRGLADRHAGGRLIAVTEGGYNLPALAASLRAFLAALAGNPRPPDPDEVPVPHDESVAETVRVLEAVRRAQAPYWRGL